MKNTPQITLTKQQLDSLREMLVTLDSSTDTIVELSDNDDINERKLGFTLGELNVELSSVYNVLSELLDEIDPEEVVNVYGV